MKKLLLVVFLCAGAVLGQQRTGSLKGQVLDRTRRQAEFRSKIEQGSRHAA